MKNWKTNLGGALSITGTALIGYGVLPQLSGEPNTVMSKIALVGFILSALGKGVGFLFAADASELKHAVDQINQSHSNPPFPTATPPTTP